MPRYFAMLLALGFYAASGPVLADPPSRAARLADVSGSVSFSPAGEGDWFPARVNRPITIGDRLWTDRGSRAEIQFGGSVIRMGENTSITLLNLDNRFVQVQLDEGTLNLRARRLAARQSVEIATPNLAFTTRRPGSYRIEVDPRNDDTSVVVRSGRGEVYGERASYMVDSRQAYRFAGTGLRSYEYIPAPRADAFERWAGERDRRAESSASARYVSPDVVGYEDLDAYGTWRKDPQYGNVWAPNRVASDWTPYRDGHWTWVEPWGWTWVDDAPWGYAVSHYGRWANQQGNWVWVPAPVRSQAVYAPALVGFVGGSNFQPSASGGNPGSVAWFPLGPREVYRPTYQASRGYYENVNRSNTTVGNTAFTEASRNAPATEQYANRLVRGAVIGMAALAFVQSQSVAKAAVQVPQQAAASAPVTAGPLVKPVVESVRGSAPAATVKPPTPERERRVVTQSAPPVVAASAATPQKDAVKPAASAPKPAAGAATNVIVAAPPQAAPPTAPPPAQAPEGKPSDRKGEQRKGEDRKGEDRKADDKKAAAVPVPVAPAPPAAAPAPVKPVPDAGKQDSAKRDADKRDSEKRDAEKRDAEKRDVEKRKADQDKADKEKSEKLKADKDKADKADSAKIDAEKRDTEKRAADKRDSEKRDAEKRDVEKRKVDQDKADKEKSEKLKADKDKADSARIDAEKRDAEKRKLDQDRADKDKADKVKAEQLKADQLKADKIKVEKDKADKADKDKADKEKAEKVKADQLKVEKMKADKEKADKAEADKGKSDKADAPKTDAEKRDARKRDARKRDSEKSDADKSDAEVKK